MEEYVNTPKESTRDQQVREGSPAEEKPAVKPSLWNRVLRTPIYFLRSLMKGVRAVFLAGFKMVGVFVSFIFFLCKLWFGLLMSIMFLFFLAFIYIFFIR